MNKCIPGWPKAARECLKSKQSLIADLEGGPLSSSAGDRSVLWRGGGGPWQLRKGNKMKPSDFKKGERVRYIPTHAEGNGDHVDCENGVVSSVNDKCVFVKYDNLMSIMITGNEPFTAQATDPQDLIKI